MQSKNNLQKLSSSGVITEFSYNFSISSVNIKNQLVWVRRSIRKKNPYSSYIFKQKYIKKSKLLPFYCENCNAFQRFKTCLSCENKLYSSQDFDSETISSQSSIHQESTVQESTTRIIDLPYTNDNEVLQEMNNWEYAMKNDECDELIDNFKYISNQNGYVRMSDTANNIYFSDNELMMDEDN
ncbi:2441_t:CDS:1 [Gigaspora rosea]|nr:2441_t:CDS:1 [Gigaspora rosea]